MMAASRVQQPNYGPSSFDFQATSPLELVRKESARRNGNRPPAVTIPPNSSSSKYSQPVHDINPSPQSQQPQPPVSPLIHSRFRRDSNATTSSRGDVDNSFMDMDMGDYEDPREIFARQNARDSFDSRNSNIYNIYAPDEDEDLTKGSGSALRDSWQSGPIHAHTGRPSISNAGPRPIQGYANSHLFASRSDEPSSPSSPSSPVPAVVVTSPGSETPHSAGRAPIVRNVGAVSNYSRPVRNARDPYEGEASSSSITPPRPNSSAAPILEADVNPESKRRVLERNLNKRRLNTPSPTPPSFSRPSTGSSTSYTGSPSSQSPNYYSSRGSAASSSSHLPPSFPREMSSSPLSQQVVSQSRLNANANARPSVNTTSSYSHLEVSLPRRPPSLRADSPVSLYSDAYSFYQLDDNSATPSPNGSTHFKIDPPLGQGTSSPLAQTYNAPAPPSPVAEPMSKAEEFLQLGIKHHEANRLRESAMCFEKSAKEGGGCGVGMLMWGLTLRHGWGCKKDEKGGFGWVRRAAEGAVADLERARLSDGLDDGGEKGVVKAELVLAIYEVGQCFFHGWGVAKDQKMGVSYYKVAARLGDADAQNDLGFALANGKGCKKDRKEAAKWYRAAVAQGHSDIGLAWIHKEKFQ